MPFRERQKLCLSPSSQVFQSEIVELPTGDFVFRSVNQSEKTLPDPALFELKNLVKAGVDLQEVNSKVLTVPTVDADRVVRKYVKQSDNKQSDNKGDEKNEG